MLFYLRIPPCDIEGPRIGHQVPGLGGNHQLGGHRRARLLVGGEGVGGADRAVAQTAVRGGADPVGHPPGEASDVVVDLG